MKLSAYLFAMVLGCLATTVWAQPVASTTTSGQPSLGVVVVDTLHRTDHEGYDYDRLTEVFGEVFARQNWPVKINFERFAANNRPYDLELRIFYRGVDVEFSERVFRAWMTLNDRGKKRDFGIVMVRQVPRAGEHPDDTYRSLFRAAAERTAALIAPYVAPGSPAPKPNR